MYKQVAKRMLRRACAVVAVGGVAILCALTVDGIAAGASPNCNYGEITLSSSPSVSLPSPSYVGNPMNSTGGGWAVCGGAPFTGYYTEWLRNGAVINGPTWVTGTPANFSYTITSADGGQSLTSAVQPCDDAGCYSTFAQSSNSIAPITCPVGPPPGGYAHAGVFAYVPGTTQESVNMQVKSDMRLIPSTAYDHDQGTIAVQNGGATLYNWLEAGIGVFGDRNQNPFYVPHFWAFYKPNGQNGTFYDLGQVIQLNTSHSIKLQNVGSGWQVIIDDQAQLPKPVGLQNLEWVTIFNEDHNQTNADCNPHHVTYTNASRQMNVSASADPPYDAFTSGLCHHWNNYYNWEIYWQSDLAIYCFGFGPDAPFDPNEALAGPPGFPEVPPG